MAESNASPRWPWNSIFFLYRQPLLDRLAQSSEFIHGRLLDIGCNDKPHERFFGARTTRWLGLDRAAYVGQNTRADVVGDAILAPFADGSFDTVLCTNVLQALPHPGRLFEVAFRLLRPSGCLLVAAPQYSAFVDVPTDYFRFTSFGLRQLAIDAGLEVVEVHPIGGTVALVFRVFCGHMPFLNRGNWVSRTLSSIAQLIGYHLDRRFVMRSNTIGWLIVCRKGTA
jgi:SAM-dependent methyltransferase